jgi:hypothetical protein
MSRSLDQEDLTIPVESETRIRTIPPTLVDERKLFDDQLRAAEEAQGEAAHALHVTILGTVGTEPSLRVVLVTAPDGPRAPPEDVWSEPFVLVDLPVASLDSVKRRVAWVLETTNTLGLKAAMIDEQWSFGAHPFRGDTDGVSALLDARMRLVGLSFEDMRVTQCTSTEVIEEDAPSELVVKAELTAADVRQQRILVELMRQPKPEPELVLAVTDWTAKQNAG